MNDVIATILLLAYIIPFPFVLLEIFRTIKEHLYEEGCSIFSCFTLLGYIILILVISIIPMLNYLFVDISVMTYKFIKPLKDK